jgi:hypothetical protein
MNLIFLLKILKFYHLFQNYNFNTCHLYVQSKGENGAHGTVAKLHTTKKAPFNGGSFGAVS